MKEGNDGHAYQLFVDLDGVLCDFDGGVIDVTGFAPHYWVDKGMEDEMWRKLANVPGGFYTQLHWLSGARGLWRYVEKFDPIILTGLPLGDWAEPQKRQWCSRELGTHVPVIACMSSEKPQRAVESLEARKSSVTPVLLDDRSAARWRWEEEAGGIFIHHKSVHRSIQKISAIFD